MNEAQRWWVHISALHQHPIDCEVWGCVEVVAALNHDAEVARLTARLAQAEALLRAAVMPHAFNCGWIRHPDFIKMVPVYECTCGLDAFLAASGEQQTPRSS